MYAKRIDDNQRVICRMFRKLGASVHVTSSLGNGFPDIVVGLRGRNYFFEIKDGKKYKCQQKLTKKETLFHLRWQGQIGIITCPQDVIDIMRKM